MSENFHFQKYASTYPLTFLNLDMDITHTHTTTDYPESYSDHTQAYSNNIDINLSSPGVDKQFALYEGSIYGPQAYAEPLNFCDSGLDSRIDMCYGSIEYCTSWDNNILSALALEEFSPTESPTSHSTVSLDDGGNDGDQLADAASLSDDLCPSLYAGLPVSTASYTSSPTPSLPCKTESASPPSSSNLSTPDYSACSTAYTSPPLSARPTSRGGKPSVPSRFTSPLSSLETSTQSLIPLSPRPSRRVNLTFIDGKQDGEAPAVSLMAIDLPSLPVNSRKRRRSVLEESEERLIHDDSDYNPRKLRRSDPPKKQRKVQKTEAKTKALAKPKIIKTKKKRHTSSHRRVVCNHRGCRTSFSRSADWIRHCETVHGIFTNRDKQNTACYKCGKVLSRADAKQRHELTCFMVLNTKLLEEEGQGRQLGRRRMESH